MDKMRKDFSFICHSNTQIIIIQSTFLFVYKQIRFATRNKILNERALAVSIHTHTMKIRIALNCSDDFSFSYTYDVFFKYVIFFLNGFIFKFLLFSQTKQNKKVSQHLNLNLYIKRAYTFGLCDIHICHIL